MCLLINDCVREWVSYITGCLNSSSVSNLNQLLRKWIWTRNAALNKDVILELFYTFENIYSYHHVDCWLIYSKLYVPHLVIQALFPVSWKSCASMKTCVFVLVWVLHFDKLYQVCLTFFFYQKHLSLSIYCYLLIGYQYVFRYRINWCFSVGWLYYCLKLSKASINSVFYVCASQYVISSTHYAS